MSERVHNPEETIAIDTARDIKKIYNDLTHDPNNTGSTLEISLKTDLLTRMAKGLPNSETANLIRKFLKLICTDEHGNIQAPNLSLYLSKDRSGGFLTLTNNTCWADLYFNFRNTQEGIKVIPDSDVFILLDDEKAGTARTDEITDFEESQGVWQDFQRLVILAFFIQAAKQSTKT